MAIFLITGKVEAAERLARDLAGCQVLQGHNDPGELVVWLRQARNLVTGISHWAVYNMDPEHVSRVYASFPQGQVRHFHIGTASQHQADYYVREGELIG